MLGQDGQSVVLDGEDWDIQGFDKSVVLDGEQFNILGFCKVSSGGDKQSNTFIKQERATEFQSTMVRSNSERTGGQSSSRYYMEQAYS